MPLEHVPFVFSQSESFMHNRAYDCMVGSCNYNCCFKWFDYILTKLAFWDYYVFNNIKTEFQTLITYRVK